MSSSTNVCTCSGLDESCNNPGTIFGTKLFNYWNTHDCPGSYSNFLFTGPNGVLQENDNNIPILQGYTNDLFTAYNKTNTITNDTNSPDYDVFQDQLLNMCLDTRLPGVCDTYLNNYCSQYSREDIENNFTLSNFCGCYVPSDIPGTTPVPAACDGLCNRGMSVKKEGAVCGNSFCIISDVNVNLLNETSNGGVTFANVCSDCDQCTCIVSGTNVSATLSNIGVGSQFYDLCGQDSVCFTQDANGNLVETSCTDVDPSVQVPYRFPYLILFICILALVLIIVCVIYYRNTF